MQPSASVSEWASLDDAITLVSAMLALVRPTGMTDRAADEWIAVAASDLAGHKLNVLKAACTEARKTCTHHGQIVPTIMKEMREITPWKAPDRKPAQSQALPPPEIQGLIEGAAKALTSR